MLPENLKQKVQEIRDGWYNHVKSLLGVLDPQTKAMAERRLAICKNCDLRTKLVCDEKKSGLHVKTGVRKFGCGCPLVAKTKSPISSCPLGKW